MKSFIFILVNLLSVSIIYSQNIIDSNIGITGRGIFRVSQGHKVKPKGTKDHDKLCQTYDIDEDSGKGLVYFSLEQLQSDWPCSLVVIDKSFIQNNREGEATITPVSVLQSDFIEVYDEAYNSYHFEHVFQYPFSIPENCKDIFTLNLKLACSNDETLPSSTSLYDQEGGDLVLSDKKVLLETELTLCCEDDGITENRNSNSFILETTFLGANGDLIYLESKRKEKPISIQIINILGEKLNCERFEKVNNKITIYTSGGMRAGFNAIILRYKDNKDTLKIYR